MSIWNKHPSLRQSTTQMIATGLVLPGGVSILGVLRSIADYLATWDEQETEGDVAGADNIAVALGRQLLVEDFTNAAWAVNGVAVIDDLDSFTTTGGAGLVQTATAISRTYTPRMKGTTSAGNITFRDIGGTIYKDVGGTGAFDVSFTFAGVGTVFYIKNEGAGTTDIDWTVSTVPQTDILASSAGLGLWDGTHSGVAVGQTGQYNIPIMAEYDGAASQTDKTSAEYNSSYTPDEFTRAIVFRKTTWDVTERWIFQDWVDANNFIGIRDSTTAGTIEFVYKTGGVEKVVSWVSGSPTDSKLLDLSVSGGVMEGRVNGVSQGTIAIGAAIVGNFAVNMLGAENDGTNVHLGFLAYDQHYTSKTTDADMVRVTNSMGIPS